MTDGSRYSGCLLNKTDELADLAKRNNMDIKGVTEVWLMKFLMMKSAYQVTSLFVKTTISIKKGTKEIKGWINFARSSFSPLQSCLVAA